MKLSEQQCACTRDAARLVNYINSQSGCSCRFGEFQRTQEQANLYAAQGKGSKNSLHIQCLAFDLAIFKNGIYLTSHDDYKFAGDYWEELDPHNQWGGNFPIRGGKIDDANHFERKPE